MPVRLSTLLASFLVISMFTFTSAAYASSVVQRSIVEIVKQSPLVFEGKVSAINVEANGKRIFTWITFDVLDVVKGSYSEPQIHLRYTGGSSGDKTLTVGDQTMPSFGEHGIYFSESLDNRTVHPLKGWGQGHFILEPDPATGELNVLNSQQKMITGLSTLKVGHVKKLDAKTAAGVKTTRKSEADGGDKPITRREFKQFITEAAK